MAVELKETIDKRREEIMDACDKLYEEKGFQDITIKDISAETNFSRPSIYNYFRSKEEIFLGLLTREYEEWNHSLLEIAEGTKTLNKDGSSDGSRTHDLPLRRQTLYPTELPN